MIDILITTCGRWTYLDRLARSLLSRWKDFDDTRIVMVKNGTDGYRSPEIDELLHRCVSQVIHTQTRLSIGQVMSAFKGHHSLNPLFLKLDEDALLLSDDFDAHIRQIHALKPDAIFSPFPTGLINNLGGPAACGKQFCEKGKMTDTFYTFRPVNHVGGFCRIMPSKYLSEIAFPSGHDEDALVSRWARGRGVLQFYMENALAVEHQESTLGQHQRYGEEYFQGRF